MLSWRTQASIDEGIPAGRPQNEPIVYDPVKDAAKLQFLPGPGGSVPGGGSSSVQQRRYEIPITSGDVFLTVDHWCDQSFYWTDADHELNQAGEEGVIKNHKAFMIGSRTGPEWPLGGDRWMLFNAVYRGFWTRPDGDAQEVYEAVMSCGEDSPIVLGPGASKVSEQIFPKNGKFYARWDRWTRYFVLLEGIVDDGQPSPVVVNVWYADPDRIWHMYQDINLVLGPHGLHRFWLEFNTSTDRVPPLRPYHAWVRNLAVLRNDPDPRSLLERPHG